MTNNAYLSLTSDKLSLHDLQSYIQMLITSGVAGLKAVGEFTLSQQAGQGTGAIRFNNDSSPAKLEFSVDGGATWATIAGVSVGSAISTSSEGTIAVPVGAFIEVSGTKTSLSVQPVGLSSGVAGESWIRVEFGETATITGNSALTVVDDPYPNAVNLLHVVFWGTEARLYVQDRWEVSNG